MRMLCFVSSLCSPSCLLASAQVGSPPRRIITASMTFSTSAGGRPYDLISVMSFLFSDSSAWTRQTQPRMMNDQTKTTKQSGQQNINTWTERARTRARAPTTGRAKKATRRRAKKANARATPKDIQPPPSYFFILLLMGLHAAHGPLPPRLHSHQPHPPKADLHGLLQCRQRLVQVVLGVRRHDPALVFFFCDLFAPCLHDLLDKKAKLSASGREQL